METTDATQTLASFLEWRWPARGRGRGHGGVWTAARAGLGKVHEQINRDEPVYLTQRLLTLNTHTQQLLTRLSKRRGTRLQSSSGVQDAAMPLPTFFLFFFPLSSCLTELLK